MLYLNRLERLLESKKVSQKELATKIGMSEGGFGKMLRQNSMKVRDLIVISDVLSVQPAYFFEDEQSQKVGIDKVFNTLRKVVEQNM